MVRTTKLTNNRYETDRRDVSFEHEYVVAFPKLDSKGIKVKVKGRVDV